MKELMILLGLVSGAKAETPAYFTANGVITRLGESVGTTIINEDLTAPGFANRFQFLTPYWCLTPWNHWTQVTVMADGQGTMWVLISGWGMMALTPRDTEVWKVMKKSTAFETRLQHVTITEHLILIEEPTQRNRESSASSH